MKPATPITTPSRVLYDEPDDGRPRFCAAPGLSASVVRRISAQKNEPDWMLNKRLRALELFVKTPLPNWGPDLSKLNLDEIVYFVQPEAAESKSWAEVPADIRRTFDRLGIPEAEKKVLAGVGAQYDSEVVYHNIQADLARRGVIFCNFDTAVREHAEIVKKYFMTQCVPVNDHKFAMLHAAVWSGGTFIYVPKDVRVELPLQAYFRLNARQGGQFEHTLIIAYEGAEVQYIEGCSAPRYDVSSLHAGCVEIFVHRGARVRYYSIENWSKNTYNLNTKRALVDEAGIIEWVSGNMGSGVTMLYPASILRGRGARSDSLGVAFAGPGQHQDTGAKAIHAAPDTKSTIRAKSISTGGGVCSYRGLVRVGSHARNSAVSVSCDALLIDDASVSTTHPCMKIAANEVDVAHEARVGKIGEEELFYLQSRGLSEEQAIQLAVAGFIEPIVKALPLEYALELNRLIELEMDGSVG
ncbi:MAG: FeS assembly protein SufB [Candidatus Magasanikbacteria bacterium GW2011_GWA2_56_11]|uniref:FeS assembly protein SufB n=1 Tax=Candidatus Magasanikbacteria bacterium GW2011_GWA2_56_11 TaxID=1619044 RepID=A0A0G1YH51_9BACT|nr:MAG: FeS assembly protein SufB [Candidatus Magasanikbacteria bacterium GW2011_GWA2_56_11]